MPVKKAEIILHPVRMRIIQALAGGKRMTAQQLLDRLGDVPQATLYRQLKKMTDAGVLLVAEEIPVRGTLEKVYMLPEKGAEISDEELKQASAEDHLALFMQFAASIIGGYGRYLQQPDADLFKDGVSYRQISLYLTDEENVRLIRSIWDLLKKAANNEPNEQRRRRLFSVIGFPDG
jgi:Fe2+/Zn2+ uptake regulation proteins